jgi:hypothetical protein
MALQTTKLRASTRASHPVQPAPPSPPPLSYAVLTVAEFCREFRLSKSFYHKLKRAGLGPKETRIGQRVLIGREAANAWFAAHEAAT